MDKWFKKFLTTLLIAFLLFYLITRPEQSAEIVKGIGGVFVAIYRFFVSLAS